MQHDSLKQIPQMAKITLPTNFIDWSTKQQYETSNVQSKNPLLVDEPYYVIIRIEEAKPRHLGGNLNFFYLYFSYFPYFN